MFTPTQYRKKAAKYAKLLETASDPNRREFQALEERSIVLADSEQRLADNCGKTVRNTELEQAYGVTLAQEKEQILRCLGAALILQWNTLPQKLRHELFDNAGTMGDLLETAEVRGKIARFLHKHKDDDGAVT